MAAADTGRERQSPEGQLRTTVRCRQNPRKSMGACTSTMKHHQRALTFCVLAIMAASADAGGQSRRRGSAPKDTASTLELSGFMQADAIYDFEQNNPDWFDVNRPSR